MRHGSHREGTLTPAGEAECLEVGRALREVLSDLPGVGAERLDQVRVLHAPTPEATRTAELVARALDPRLEWHPDIRLNNPRNIYAGDRALSAATRAAANGVASEGTGTTLAIGHLPSLTWIAQEITGSALPIGRSELLAVELTNRWRSRPAGVMRWALTPSARGKELIAELREKIKSKMEAAKFLASFVTATLGVQLALLLDPTKLRDLETGFGRGGSVVLGASAALLVLSAGLFFVTVFAYDKLLMPPTLWADRKPRRFGGRPGWLAWRPPSGASWILLQNMQRVWKWIFTPATVFLLIGVTLQAVAAFYRRMDWAEQWRILIGIAVLTLLIVGLLLRAAWPRLGSED